MCNLVSIIIPLYNVEQYVEVALESAFNQTFADIEYILVDDCSTDQTMEVVDRLVAECSLNFLSTAVCLSWLTSS